MNNYLYIISRIHFDHEIVVSKHKLTKYEEEKHADYTIKKARIDSCTHDITEGGRTKFALTEREAKEIFFNMKCDILEEIEKQKREILELRFENCFVNLKNNFY